MTGQSLAPAELLQRRFALVTALSELNARTHKLVQELSAIDLDLLRIELEIRREPADVKLVQELQEVEQRAAALRASRSDCDDETAAVEAEMDEIDLLLAESRGGVS